MQIAIKTTMIPLQMNENIDCKALGMIEISVSTRIAERYLIEHDKLMNALIARQ